MHIKLDQLVVYHNSVWTIAHVRYSQLQIININSNKSTWVKRVDVVPLSVQEGDKVKVTTLLGTAVCQINEIRYDDRGNLKIHSPHFDVLTNYTAMYYEDFIELADSFDTTTF